MKNFNLLIEYITCDNLSIKKRDIYAFLILHIHPITLGLQYPAQLTNFPEMSYESGNMFSQHHHNLINYQSCFGVG
jgi:hypothetical protein